MENPNTQEKDNTLLNKLALAYYENEGDNEISIVFNNKELKSLLLYTKGGLAWEDALDYELFNRRQLKKEFIDNKNK